MMVGVNGSGKTTSISKISKYYMNQGLKVGLIAADTLEQEQLNNWKSGQKGLEYIVLQEKKMLIRSVLVDGRRYYLENPVDIIIADTKR